MPFDWSLMAAQIASEADAQVNLSGSSLALCLSALEQMENRYSWVNGADLVSDALWDTIEGYIAQAIYELLTEAECEGMLYAIATHNAAGGVDGGTSYANALNQRPVSIQSDPHDLLAVYSDEITLASGVYLVKLWGVSVSAGDHWACLYNELASSIAVQGIITNQGISHGVQTLSTDGTNTYTLRHWTAETQASYGLGRACSNSSYANVYAQIEFIRVGDYE